MLIQILKKDMMKRKGVNFILFLFITIATIFLTSSINNIMIVTSAVDYYMEYANVPDLNLVLNTEIDKEKIDTWLKQQTFSETVIDYDYNQFYVIADQSITVKKDTQSSKLDNQGTAIYLSTLDSDYSQVFDKEGKPLDLKDGEIAVSISMMKRSQLNIGDTLIIRHGNTEKEFRIAKATKDAAFGNEMIGMSRFIVNEKEFKEFSEDSIKIGIYYIVTNEPIKLVDGLNEQGFNGIMNTITIDMYKLVYSFDMIMAALLILIGICLILIALLVLRFTLVFSLEEQYQEIGILKAIGLRNYSIKKLYLIKYFVIVVVGATLGTLISIPISQIMIDSVSQNMIMANSSVNMGINILCALIIIVLVSLFCYFCTRKLNKVSAITAIRGGYTGERFSKRKGIHLSRSRHLSVPFYLGINDIMNHLPRYIILMITFCMSFILITIPLNTINTMKSDEMAKKFNYDPSSAVYIHKIEDSQNQKYRNSKDLMEGVARVEKEMKEKGYDAKISAIPIYFINYEYQGDTSRYNIMSTQLLGKENTFSDYSAGTAPILQNEIAFSQGIMTERGWTIGDYVEATINGEKKTMIITGIYSDYMQLGKSARLNNQLDCSQEVMFDYWTLMVDMETELTQREMASLMNKEFPDYEWNTAQDQIDQNVGGIQAALSEMNIPMTAMLCAVIMLITLLMEKLFITREKGEIAMMKSIGFTYRTIRHWQLTRMVLVVLASMIISIPLSLLSNHYILKPIFAVMGADVAIQVNPLQTYLLYPGILLIGIMMATSLATRGIKKINIREMNNLE
ncbi:FtsX-like permease family protein [Beduini massiliensis]|uniref:FtsX-like permease family protein n=1 Tax=Beduini massiliensis TaxID=1585974 RepID=UPI00059A8CF7|nr:ABC transporter permease [Beduini massiliensis]